MGFNSIGESSGGDNGHGEREPGVGSSQDPRCLIFHSLRGNSLPLTDEEAKVLRTEIVGGDAFTLVRECGRCGVQLVNGANRGKITVERWSDDAANTCRNIGSEE